MKESWSETLWNEEIRRCEVIDIAEKVKETRFRASHIYYALKRSEEDVENR